MKTRRAEPEVLPEEKALMQGATELTTLAERFSTIVLRDDAEDAGQFLRGVRTRIRQIEAYFKDLRSDLNAAIKKNRAREQQALAPWLAADAMVSRPLGEWLQAEKQRVEAENRRRLAEADERARAEQAASVEALRAAAAAAPTATERAALERQARQVIRTTPMPVLTGPVAEAPKIAGVATPTRKVGVVVDPTKFLRGILDGKIPLSAIMYNQPLIDKQANDLGDLLNWPGVIVQDKTSLSARGL